ncbi:MAG: amino acid ABC transporter permease [Candidatus Njordarchaeia archaeon]
MASDPITGFIEWVINTILFLAPHYMDFIDGAFVTLQVATLAFFIANIIGIVMGIMRVSGVKILEIISTIYVEVIRGTPVVVQLLIIYFGIPIATGIRFPPFVAGVITFAINSGAYQAEIVRSGIKGIPYGQMEAAKSLGFTYWQSMRYIIIPQALRIVIPAFVNEYSTVLKDTSILIVIGFPELTRRGQYIAARTFKYFEVYVAIAAIYLLMVYTISKIARIIEKKAAIPGLGLAGGR